MEIENLKVGTWYKSKMQNYFKFKEFKNSYFYSSEEIFNKIWTRREEGWAEEVGGRESGWTKELTEASLSEIQQYLPDGHVDKINIEKEVLVQTGLNQSEACDSCKYHNDCSKGPHNKTGNERCPAINGQHYPKQENQIPEYLEGKWAEIVSPSEKKAEIPWTVGGWVRLTKDFKYKGNNYKKGEYHQITAVSQSVNPSVVNFKYTDNLGNTLKVEAYTQFSTQTPECEWIGMNQPSWYEEQDRLVTERIKNFNIFIGYNATSDSYENKQPELFKKNKGTSVEVLPLQKPCLISTKKKKSKLIFN